MKVLCFFVQSSPELETSSQQGLKRRKLEGAVGRTAPATSSLPVASGRHRAPFRVADKKKTGEDEMDSLTSSDDESGAEDGGKVSSLFVDPYPNWIYFFGF